MWLIFNSVASVKNCNLSTVCDLVSLEAAGVGLMQEVGRPRTLSNFTDSVRLEGLNYLSSGSDPAQCNVSVDRRR